MEIRPIERTNVGEQVFDQLKQLLIEGTWTPGQRLPSENELANMLHVSRVTVRQALQKLSALDLIETRLGEGSFVKKIDVGSNMNALIPVMYMGEQSLQQVLNSDRSLMWSAPGLLPAALRWMISTNWSGFIAAMLTVMKSRMLRGLEKPIWIFIFRSHR